MKKPDDKKTAGEDSAASSTKAEKTAAKHSETGKKAAAAPGTLKVADTGPGDGKEAAAGGGEVQPVDSTLLGKSGSGRPPAAAKTAPVAPAGAAADTTAAPTAPGPAAKPADEPVEASAATPAQDSAPKDGAATASGPADAAPGSSLPVPAQPVTIQRTGFWPVALGGVVAAGLGAAATIWALPHLPAGWLPPADTAPAAEAAAPVDAAAIRADAIAAAEAAARSEVQALRDELASTAAVEVESGNTLAEPAGPAVSAEDLAVLQARLDEQAARLDELASRPVLDGETAQRVQTLADQAGALEQQIAAAAADARSEITAAQAEAQKLQDAAQESTRRAEAVAAIAALQAALDRGVTPDEAHQQLAAVGLDTPDALSREVPSLESLQSGFGEAARAGLRAALREDSAGGGNVLTNFLRAQTGARSVAPREGDDPDAILSRANAEVEAGRIAAALDEIATLPETARSAPAMAGWIDGATAYRDAQSALSDLSANSN